jgi:hypothetical protein
MQMRARSRKNKKIWAPDHVAILLPTSLSLSRLPQRWIRKRLEATNLRTENRQNAENTRRKHPCWAAVATNRNGCPAGIKEILRAQSHAVLTESKNRFYLRIPSFVGPCPDRDRNYRISSKFWKSYLLKTSFTLGELVFLVKVFRLFRSEGIFFVFGLWTQCVDVQHLIYWQGQRVCGSLFLWEIGDTKKGLQLIQGIFLDLFFFQNIISRKRIKIARLRPQALACHQNIREFQRKFILSSLIWPVFFSFLKFSRCGDKEKHSENCANDLF